MRPRRSPPTTIAELLADLRAARLVSGAFAHRLALEWGEGVLAGLPEPFEATRYHSLVVDADSVPDVLEVTATADDGTVMALRHRKLPVEGVQFHPESILTEGGHRLLGNFLERVS